MGAGPTRSARFLDLRDRAWRRHPVGDRGRRGQAGAEAAVCGGVDDCQVVAACLNHELALEDMTGGVRNGLLTRAFVSLMGQVDGGEVRSAPWARVWQRCGKAWKGPTRLSTCGCPVVMPAPCSRARRRTATQASSSQRAAGEYLIDAGTLADVGEGAKLAVYGDKPPYFPPLGSPEDLRRGSARPS